jgi:hypothetical protein
VQYLGEIHNVRKVGHKIMNYVQIEPKELKVMRDKVSRTINALELCWGCQRVCECKQWFINGSARWLCGECLPN